jgi:hypothetical protein
MSRYVVENENIEFLFGWDQPMLTFFLQINDKHADEDDGPLYWYGTGLREIYEVEDLASIAKRHGLQINHERQVNLYSDKDLGR